MADFYLFLTVFFTAIGVAAILSAIIACFSDGFEKYQLLVAVGGILLIGCAFITGKTVKTEYRKKPVIVTTKVNPQIDTTITISNGVADTVYTYHLVKE